VLFVDDSLDTKGVKAVQLADDKYRSSTFSVQIYHREDEDRWGGLSGAVTDGVARAQCDRVIIMDGDLQHPPELLPDMIAASLIGDVVMASRYREGGSASGLDGGIRHLVSRSSTLLAKAFFPLRLRKVSDPMTGFFLINRRQIDTSKLRPKGFKILLEILATHPHLTVAEVPLQFAERVNGESHGNIKQGIEFVNQLIRLRYSQLISVFDRLPKFVVFGGIGGSVFVAGMAMLYFMVSVLGVSPLLANAIQLAITFWLNYVLNRKITWRERSVDRQAIYKFMTSRVATSVLNYLLFAWLISQQYALPFFGRTISFSINYLAANIIGLAVIMALNYVISDSWAFAEPKQTDGRVASMWQTFVDSMSMSVYAFTLLVIVVTFSLNVNVALTLSILMAIVSLVLFIQSSIEAWRMIYTYRDPSSTDALQFPTSRKLRERFCLIVPARHEAGVLASTLRQLAKQTHPDVTIIAVICDDDYDTLRVAHEVEDHESRVKVMTYPLQDSKPSKPKQLNYVFSLIKDADYTVIGVIDAEDTVHPELTKHIDAAFRDRKIGIVQGGVQLMNHDSSWYSLHNVLEYYRWFGSAMTFQADQQFMPLGGNTIFIRKDLLKKTGGWPETLTEDCSLGVLLSSRHQVKTAVYYEPRLATREETPDSLKGLFKQRVRWNQGFYHEWRQGVWKELPTLRQRLLADYILLGPVMLAGISVLMPLSLLSFFFLDTPVGLAMIMYLPMIPIALHVMLNAMHLHDFGKAFQRKVQLRHYVVMFATQIAYQILLSAAAFWAVIRELRGEYSWYKTPHSGQHRLEPEFAYADGSAMMFGEEPIDA
jgi:cellulose synthase/poly-beta-1,6-N-acetylglucosamine synthase-like glycosyltransferase